MVLLRLHIDIENSNMAWKTLFAKRRRPEIWLSQSQTPAALSPLCSFGKRDACCVTRSSLCGFGVGAMLAAMLTGGWMWNCFSPSRTFLSSRRWMTCCTKSLLKSWVVGSQLPYNPLLWLLGVNHIVFFLSCEWGEWGDMRMMRTVHVHHFGMKINKLWFIPVLLNLWVEDDKINGRDLQVILLT